VGIFQIANVRKVTVSFVMSVCPSGRPQETGTLNECRSILMIATR